MSAGDDGQRKSTVTRAYHTITFAPLSKSHPAYDFRGLFLDLVLRELEGPAWPFGMAGMPLLDLVPPIASTSVTGEASCVDGSCGKRRNAWDAGF